MHEKEVAKIRKRNMKLYPIYQMVGWDLMFFYAIQILFLMQVKDFSASSSVLLSSFYAFFSMVLYIPLNMVVSKMGKKNAMILGNIFTLIYFIMWIFCNEYHLFIIAEFFCAVGFALKGITENAFLNASIPKAERKSEIFTKINENGYSKYSYFSALTMIVSGFLYDINPYIPLVCGAICIVITIMISTNFTETDLLIEVEEEAARKKRKSTAQIFKRLISSLKFIFKSERLRALLLMIAVIGGLLSLLVSYRTTLLESIGCTATFIGAVAAISELIKGWISTKANEFNERNGNKSLTIIVLTITIAMIIAGLVVSINAPFDIQLIIVLIAFIAIYVVKGIYQVIRSTYLNNFASSKILTKIYSVDGIASNFAKMVITFIGSAMLAVMEIKYAIIVVGIIFTIIAVLISKYMKTRVGLKPEEYRKEDIEYKG